MKNTLRLLFPVLLSAFAAAGAQEYKFDFGDGAAPFRLGPLHGEMRQLVNLSLRDFQHPATELSKVGIGVGVDTQGGTQTDYIDFPHRLPSMQAKRTFLI